MYGSQKRPTLKIIPFICSFSFQPVSLNFVVVLMVSEIGGKQNYVPMPKILNF